MLQDNKGTNSNVIGDSVFAVKKNLQEILNQFELLCDELGPKLSFIQFSQTISDHIDEVIIQTEAEQEVVFVGGHCVFFANQETSLVETSVNLYYQTSDKNWTNQSFGCKTKFSRFNDDAIANEISELIRNGKHIVSVDAPNK